MDPVPGIHTAHPDTDMKVKEQKTSDASPSDEAMAAIQPHKPNHEVAASVDAAAHGQSLMLLAPSLAALVFVKHLPGTASIRS